MTRLTTHVLDTASGRPAGGVRIDLYALDDGRRQITSAVTNTDGRTDAPLLDDEAAPGGIYELVFHAGAYFTQAGQQTASPPFLDEVVIRFGLAGEAHYHVPLLVSPWSYSTYRGS